ncbi:GOLPH3/VPS74 family protein [Quadrisphaera sp. KR29]|uniref:GOLPH3/VPS74 family protein n=1 Tax=Quadrisphaera sp. KR29 TaxID=3461391 RepID=UPI0040447B14
MLIAEDLALLLLDDAKGTWLLDSSHRGPVLAGAVLTELVLAGRLRPEPGADGREPGPKAKLVVVDDAPLGDPVLDAALARIGARRPSRADALLGPVAKGLEPELVSRLVAAGAVTPRQEKVLLVFSRTTHPAADPSAERSVRDRVASALRGGRADDERTAALVALLSVSKVLPKVVDPASVGLDRKGLEAAGKAVAADDRIAGSVKHALASVDAAVMVAVMVPVFVAGSS